MGGMPFCQASQPGAGSPLTALAPLVIIFLIFYFLLILPQQKKQKEHRKMLDALKKGDRIVTVGGIIGEVEKVKDNVVTLKLSESVFIDVVRNAVSQVIQNNQEAKIER